MAFDRTGQLLGRFGILRVAAVSLVLAPVAGRADETSPSSDAGAEPAPTPLAATEDQPRVVKIMPLGASNTYGMYADPTSPGGYRGPLHDLLTAQNARFDFVGLDRDGAIPDADHNGYPGKPIGWFTRPVDETVREERISFSVDSGGLSAVQHFIEQAEMTPDDVVLLLVGTNNVREGDSAETMLAEIQVLLDQIVHSEASPLVHLMTLTPIGGDFWEDGDPSRTNNDTIGLFNEGLEELAASRYGSLGVTLVDSATTAGDRSSDGVHLNEAGYRKLAAAWLDSLLATGHVAPGPAEDQPVRAEGSP